MRLGILSFEDSVDSTASRAHMFRTTQDINKITLETAFEFCERLKEAKWWWWRIISTKNMGHRPINATKIWI